MEGKGEVVITKRTIENHLKDANLSIAILQFLFHSLANLFSGRKIKPHILRYLPHNKYPEIVTLYCRSQPPWSYLRPSFLISLEHSHPPFTRLSDNSIKG